MVHASFFSNDGLRSDQRNESMGQNYFAGEMESSSFSFLKVLIIFPFASSIEFWMWLTLRSPGSHAKTDKRSVLNYVSYFWHGTNLHANPFISPVNR